MDLDWQHDSTPPRQGDVELPGLTIRAGELIARAPNGEVVPAREHPDLAIVGAAARDVVWGQTYVSVAVLPGRSDSMLVSFNLSEEYCDPEVPIRDRNPGHGGVPGAV